MQEKKFIKLRIALTLALALCLQKGMAQVSVKNNLAYDALLSPNLGIEVGLAPKWSADVSGSVNFWTLKDNQKWKHWMVQPEARYWLCQKFNGHFFALHAQGGQFNAGKIHLPFGIYHQLRDHRYEGWFAGAGVGYGYQWPLSKHWSFEGEIGVGYNYVWFKKFPCEKCGHELWRGHKNYFGPTKAALNVIYNF